MINCGFRTSKKSSINNGLGVVGAGVVAPGRPEAGCGAVGTAGDGRPGVGCPGAGWPAMGCAGRGFGVTGCGRDPPVMGDGLSPPGPVAGPVTGSAGCSGLPPLPP